MLHPIFATQAVTHEHFCWRLILFADFDPIYAIGKEAKEKQDTLHSYSHSHHEKCVKFFHSPIQLLGKPINGRNFEMYADDVDGHHAISVIF